MKMDLTYYYENGVKVTGMLKEISDEDGNTYGYYFDWNGRLQKNCRNYVNHIFENLTYIQGWVRSDENGHLYQDSCIMMEVGKNIMDMTIYAQGERQLQLMRIFITLMKTDI